MPTYPGLLSPIQLQSPNYGGLLMAGLSTGQGMRRTGLLAQQEELKQQQAMAQQQAYQEWLQNLPAQTTGAVGGAQALGAMDPAAGRGLLAPHLAPTPDPMAKFRAFQAMSPEEQAQFEAYSAAVKPGGVDINLPGQIVAGQHGAKYNVTSDPTTGAPVVTEVLPPGETPEELEAKSAKKAATTLGERLATYWQAGTEASRFRMGDPLEIERMKTEIAWAIARKREPSGKLTDEDIRNAKTQVPDPFGLDHWTFDRQMRDVFDLYNLNPDDFTKPPGGDMSPLPSGRSNQDILRQYGVE